MSETYLHGTYGTTQAVGTKVAQKSRSAIVYVGTAPAHLTAKGADCVNKPVVVHNMAEARRYFGYSDDWAKYTLCEAMDMHFEHKGVGPLVLINVLDPAKHKKAEGGTVSLTPENGRITIANAEDIILSSVKAGEKVPGTDYAATYDQTKKVIILTELTKGALGTAAISISYDSIDAAQADAACVIGESDGEGLNTGLYAIKNVYQETGYIPSFLVAPGFSEDPEVHGAMAEVSRKINGHWDAYMMTDMPIADGGTALTLTSAAAWKKNNGYNRENETVSFPIVQGGNGKKYHLSTLRAAALQELLLENDGIPFRSASNTECGVIENLYLGESNKGRIFDDELINEKLNKHGIASAAYVGGRWALWGAHSADYSQTEADSINVAETNRMMLYYICNDFQHRRMGDVDKPKTANDIAAIIADEQRRLDALVKIGALTFGEVSLDAELDNESDIMMGDFQFAFRVTTTPLAKSLTANVYWTSEGYKTYYSSYQAA